MQVQSEPVPVRVREQMAIEMATNHVAPSLTVAAGRVGCAPSTVMHRKNGRKSRKEEEEGRQKLTAEEEKQVLERCYFRCRLGFPPTIWQWKEIAYSVIHKRRPDETLGKTWERNFRRRHPEVKSRFCAQLDFVRNTQGNNLELMTKFFDQYVSIVQEFEIKPHNTYNIDEIGFVLGVGKSERVLEVVRHPRERGALKFRAQNGSREFITVIEGICGDGSTLDPTIILKAEEFIAEWFHKLPQVPENILFGKSHNGWTDENMAKKFLERNFGTGSITEEKAKATNDYRLLLFDGHSSHVNMAFLEFCIGHMIIPFCLPPHTTHRLQPLDVAIFSPYKHFYQQELTKRFENHDYGIGKDNFYEVLMAARRQAFTPKNIASSYRNTGLIPADGTIVLQKLSSISSSHEHSDTSSNINTPSSQIHERTNPLEILNHTNPTNDSPRSVSPCNSNDSQPIKPLGALTAEEIHHLTVPITRDEIEKQELMVYSTLRCNDPTSWGLKKVIGNVAITARQALTELQVKDQRIMNLESQLALAKERRVRNRTRIPTHGKAWVDRQDIQNFFAEQVRTRQKTAEQRHQNLINLIAGRKERLADCQRKRKDAETLEAQGRLPKRRKTHSQLKDEESRLCHQIHEAETRLRSLELHIDDMEGENVEYEEDQNAPEDGTFLADGIHEGTHVVCEGDHDWDRNEANTAPTPAPCDALI